MSFMNKNVFVNMPKNNEFGFEYTLKNEIIKIRHILIQNVFNYLLVVVKYSDVKSGISK